MGSTSSSAARDTAWRAWLMVGLFTVAAAAADPPAAYDDPTPKLHVAKARASELDARARPHPDIDFVFDKDGKPEDLEHAAVDTRANPRGKLVVWLMAHNGPLFERLAASGLHVVQPHYANKWFALVKPSNRMARGLVRLEAATGRDVSDQVAIPEPDGMMERTRVFLAWLARAQPQGQWDQFLNADGTSVRWETVTIAGASHGATTAARFAQEVRCDRVVMLCGPRDQDQDWQAGPAATPPERFFGFSHALDDGWIGHHYSRSWEMLGLAKFGPIVDVDMTDPPYGNTRRLVSHADVKGDRKKAHGAVQPGGNAPTDAAGRMLYEPVWEYLFTHPVDEVGQPALP